MFSMIPNGRLVGSLFLISLSLLAFLSLIAAYQVPVSSLRAKWSRYSKKQLILGLGFVQILLVLPTSLFPDLIGPLDLIFGSGMQVLGSLFVMLGIWWGVRQMEDFNATFLTMSVPKWNRQVLLVWLKWIAPATLLAVLVGYIYNSLV